MPRDRLRFTLLTLEGYSALSNTFPPLSQPPPQALRFSHGRVACSKRSDSGERCGVEKAMKSRGGLGRELLFRAPFYFAPLPTI